MNCPSSPIALSEKASPSHGCSCRVVLVWNQAKKTKGWDHPVTTSRFLRRTALVVSRSFRGLPANAISSKVKHVAVPNSQAPKAAQVVLMQLHGMHHKAPSVSFPLRARSYSHKLAGLPTSTEHCVFGQASCTLVLLEVPATHLLLPVCCETGPVCHRNDTGTTPNEVVCLSIYRDHNRDSQTSSDRLRAAPKVKRDAQK